MGQWVQTESVLLTQGLSRLISAPPSRDLITGAVIRHQRAGPYLLACFRSQTFSLW